jgi:hypothetical protein
MTEPGAGASAADSTVAGVRGTANHNAGAGGGAADTGGALARRDEPPETVALRDGGLTRVVGWPELAGWAGRHPAVLGGVALVAAEVIWKALLLSHFYFWQDDFQFLDRGLGHGLGWQYLMSIQAGHLAPGPQAIAWAMARVALYDWAAATSLTVVLLAAAGLAALRLLVTLFGARPAILIPLAVYLLTPLTLPALGWWSSAIEYVPLQLATFMALNAHVRYLRGGRFRHAVAAAAWLAAGLLFLEKGMAVPLLLFAVTSAFFAPGRWPAAMRRATVTYWRAWALYGVILVGYLTVFALRLGTYHAGPRLPDPYHDVFSFVTGLLKTTTVPGALGGPWQWLPSGAFAYARPPSGLAWLSCAVAAAVVAYSIWNRKHAWRAWAILFGWLVAADMLPVIAIRFGDFSGSVLALDTRNVADAAPVLAVCLGLAFWPVAGQPDSRRPWRQRVAGAQLLPAARSAVLGAFVLGSLWSVQAYQNATTSAGARTFITNARAALSTVPYGSLIADQQVPPTVMLGIFGPYSFDSKVIGAMAAGVSPSELRWVAQPAGTIDHLLVFGPDGTLRDAVILDDASPPLPPRHKCFAAQGRTITVPLREPARTGPALRISYYDSLPGTRQVTVTVGGHSQRLTLRPGLHYGYLPVSGAAASVEVTGLDSRQLCISKAETGGILPGGPALTTAAGGPAG